MVSSPTDDLGGGRNWLVAYEGEVTAGQRHIIGKLGHGANPVTLANDLTILEGGAIARDQVQPHVDSDGCRFCVVHSEVTFGADWDVYASTFDVRYGSTIGVTEGHVLVASRSNPEFHPRVTSIRSGGGSGGSARYGMVWDDTVRSTEADIGAATYDGVNGGGLTILPNGCGVGMTTSGTTHLGGTATFALTGVSGVPVMALSVPMTPTVCNGCSIAVDLNNSVMFGTATLSLPLPCTGEFVGLGLAVQGFTLGSGPCLNVARSSDTAVFVMD